MARAATVEILQLSDGRSLCVRWWPGPGGPQLVVLHGLLDSSEGWADVCERIPCGWIVFDLPGFGYSDPPQRGSIDGYAQDVAEGLALLGVEQFALVGHSLGGAVATALAELMPARVTALILLAPAGFGRIRLAEAASIPGVRNLIQAALPFALGSRLAVSAGYFTMVTNGRTPERELVDRVTSRAGASVDGAREATRAVVECGRARQAFHRRRVHYDEPVLALWGGRDRLVPPAHRDGVERAFPQAGVHVWPGMGHHPLRERFDDLIELLERAALGSVAAPPRTRLPLVDAA